MPLKRIVGKWLAVGSVMLGLRCVYVGPFVTQNMVNLRGCQLSKSNTCIRRLDILVTFLYE